MLYINKLFDWKYLTVEPPTTMVYFWIILVALSLCIIISIILWLSKKAVNSDQKLQRKLLGLVGNWLFYPAIIGLILIFMRNQGIVIISWRVWLVALAVVWVIGIIYCLYFVLFAYRKGQKEIRIQKIKSKYMPTSAGNGR